MSEPRRLVEILTNLGALTPQWTAAVSAIDRALFVPDTFRQGERVVDRAETPATWARYVHGDLALTTQVNDGDDTNGSGLQTPTSSTSMPSLMLDMLELLEVSEGHRVAEIGTGTGYNAAWLAHRLGDASVVTIETDPTLAERARTNLAAAGRRPTVVCGDGLAGIPQHAPFDRLICTCSVQTVPYAWIEQTPAGRIVTPWGNGFFSASFAVLDVADGVAHGRFTGRPAFMWARQQRPGRGFLSDHLDAPKASETTTGINPETLYGDLDQRFAVSVGLPGGIWPLLVEADDGSDESTLWLLTDDARSWASVDYVPGHETFCVEQGGPRRLWDEVEAAHQRWATAGSPSRDRFGLTVTADGQAVWLDEPRSPYAVAPSTWGTAPRAPSEA
ncbi:methyltransferase domain-containing protein [Streptomyces chumphonensis]|uniref:Protein-L-isoaspartate O-methyltransferase n=1 Tax=Streptomyces chumphonensis TaxID=1214925 RepID=A0A927IE84_9ACTN|nr:methyltransferase domain-containing protein [Streptomyces chumphonensis]MBD3933449.1 methyltransferase domain-containing protein [Streptomyces chumphonensis]